METYMILTSIGKDRPGIVDEVSAFLYERGANIEDSRMAVMGGQFVIMMLFSTRSEDAVTIRNGIAQLKHLGIDAYLHQAEEPSPSVESEALPLSLDVTAMDHPGIVQKIVHIFRINQVNIQSLQTRVISAPLSGTPLFNLNIEGSVPVSVSIAGFKKALEMAAAEMNVDLNFRS